MGRIGELVMNMRQVISSSQFLELAQVTPTTKLKYKNNPEGYQVFNGSQNITLFYGCLLGIPLTFSERTKEFYVPCHITRQDKWIIETTLIDRLGKEYESVRTVKAP